MLSNTTTRLLETCVVWRKEEARARPTIQSTSQTRLPPFAAPKTATAHPHLMHCVDNEQTLLPRSTCIAPVAAVDFEFFVASPDGRNGRFNVVTGGSGCTDYDKDLSGEVAVGSTGGWGVFEPLHV